MSYRNFVKGTSDADFAKVDAIMDVVDVPFICLDVANGYSEHVRTECSFFNFFSFAFLNLIS